MIRKPICLIVLFAIGMTCATSPGQEQDFSDTAVAGAISKAIDYLWAQQRGDGGWAAYGQAIHPHYFPNGPGALATLARGDPAATKAVISIIRKQIKTPSPAVRARGTKLLSRLAPSGQNTSRSQ